MVKHSLVLLIAFLHLAQVHIRSALIINGVCVLWRGWLDVDRLEGVAAIEFDHHMAQVKSVSKVYLCR